MERSKTQFARLMELDRRIRAGRYPNCLGFAAEWEVAQKTVQRDIDYLRDQLGAPVAYDRVRKGFYYTDAHWFLPTLSLSEGDLLALLVADKAVEPYRGTPVARELARVFEKLARMLSGKITLRPELVFTRFSFTAPPAKPVDEKIWTCVVRGLLSQRWVRISYRAMEAPAAKERRLAPYHLANLQGEWYVFGLSDVDGELRQFALPRIQKAQLTDEPFELPADFDPERLLAHTFGRFSLGKQVHTVRLLFEKEIVPWVLERQWHSRQRTVTRADGRLELSFKITGLFEVFRWVLAWGRYARVLAPPELKQMVWAEIRAMEKRYDKQEAGDGTRT